MISRVRPRSDEGRRDGEREGKAPTEEQLQLLANSCSQIKDAACYGKAMEMLAQYYPKRDYWLSVIYSIATRPGFPSGSPSTWPASKIETARCAVRTSTDAAQLALQDGFPMDAVRIIDKGYASGILGTGSDAARHKRLKDMRRENLAEDKKALAREESQSVAGKDGRVLSMKASITSCSASRIKAGVDGEGDPRRKGLQRLEHAKLQLGYAYHLAGPESEAIQSSRR